MTKRQIKKLLKLEKMLEKELSEMYTECMVSMFPMIDNQGIPLPSKKKVANKIEKKIHEQYAELKNSKVMSSIIMRFVSKKYEVLQK